MKASEKQNKLLAQGHADREKNNKNNVFLAAGTVRLEPRTNIELSKKRHA